MIQDLIKSDEGYKNWILNSGITFYEILSQLGQIGSQEQDDLVAAITKCSGEKDFNNKLKEFESFLVNDLN
jgi:hypothetical protein